MCVIFFEDVVSRAAAIGSTKPIASSRDNSGQVDANLVRVLCGTTWGDQHVLKAGHESYNATKVYGGAIVLD